MYSKAGSLVLCDARVLHAARKNQTAASRDLLLIWHAFCSRRPGAGSPHLSEFWRLSSRAIFRGGSRADVILCDVCASEPQCGPLDAAGSVQRVSGRLKAATGKLPERTFQSRVGLAAGSQSATYRQLLAAGP